jgi:beta-glucosidase
LYFAKGCPVNTAGTQADLDEAVQLAGQSDVVVLVCGTDLDTGSEGHDIASLSLPGSQENLVRAVYRANPRTVLVLVTGFLWA